MMAPSGEAPLRCARGFGSNLRRNCVTEGQGARSQKSLLHLSHYLGWEIVSGEESLQISRSQGEQDAACLGAGESGIPRPGL